jgi:hypothetical protein
VIERVQRNAVVACLAMAAIAAAISRSWAAPAAVLGGGVLIGISFVSIQGALGAFSARRRVAFALLKAAGRYALLGFLAYVMIARLRLPPLGLIAGVSSVVAAVLVEAVRLLVKRR